MDQPAKTHRITASAGGDKVTTERCVGADERQHYGIVPPPTWSGAECLSTLVKA